MTTKKKKELKPKADIVKSGVSQKDMQELSRMLNEQMVVSDDDSSDSFYRNIVNNLFNQKDISLKTEYLDVKENFSGAKLAFLSQYANMPYLDRFITIFETKRVSLERKGRKEILMALQERRQEEQADKMNQLKSVFGV